MNNSWYSFDIAPSWVLFALVLALGVAILLYSKKKTPWSKPLNILMGFLRFGAIFLIILLVLNPLVEYNSNKTEEPIIVLAIDNSESIKLRDSGTKISDLNTWLSQTVQSLGGDYRLEVEGLNNDSADASGKITNLSKLLKDIETKYEHEHLGAIVLASDGIINNGQSPDYLNFESPVYTVGLGDTIPPKDITIQNIRNNKVAYQGNKFPVVVHIYQKGYNGTTSSVNILESGRIINSQNITFDGASEELTFLISANTAGLRRFTIVVENQEGESSYENNKKDIYVDVVEGKDRILILAPAPHPDITSLRTVLEESENYETILYIPGIHKKPGIDEFDLIIEHQAFSGTSYGDFKSSGKWYIMGKKSRTNLLNQSINFLNINTKAEQKDQVRGVYQPEFTKFKLDQDVIERLGDYPPISSPFGDYSLSGPTETLLQQQIGSITTTRPLLVFYDDGKQKTGLMTGDGFWQWKMQEFGANNDSKLFNDLIQKTVQYLSIKVNKDRFVVKPRQANYQIGDQVILDTEVYNEIFERAYGNKINLTITSQGGDIKTYELVDNPANSSFKIGVLEPGIYTFKASTELGSNEFFEQGSFVIRDIQIEGINLTADHNLLRRIAANTGGKFYSFQSTDNLVKDLKDSNLQNRISTARQKLPLIESIWIILLIALFLTIEWFLRKYLGAY